MSESFLNKIENYVSEKKQAEQVTGEILSLAKGKLDWSPKSNWVEDAGGLPKFIEDMAVHMMENSGLTREHAIAASVERTKVLAAKGNRRAIQALAQWEKMKAKSNVSK